MVLFLDQWRSLITNVMAVHERYFIVFFIHHFGQLASFIHSFIYIYCTHRMCFFLLNFKWKLINLTFYSSVKEFRQHKIILFLYSSDLSHTLQHRHNFGIWSILQKYQEINIANFDCHIIYLHRVICCLFSESSVFLAPHILRKTITITTLYCDLFIQFVPQKTQSVFSNVIFTET